MRKVALIAVSIFALLFAVMPRLVEAQATMVDGQVQKIDQAAGKITLRHGPIKNLEMDAMTMVFRVQDSAMLKQLKVGDKVKFEAGRVNGQLTVTKMQKSN